MGTTLPARDYGDPSSYERERQAVWRSEWLMVATAAELAEPRRYVAIEVARMPIFLVRDPDGTLRGFHNVCPHRAGVIVWPGDGVAGNLVCRYHGWAFEWDGALRSARDFGDDPGLCAAEQSLHPIAVAEWRGLIFAHLGAQPTPFEPAIAPFAAACAPFELERFRPRRRMVRELACNWKTYADNYLEGYHVPLLHPSLARAIDMSTYRIEVPDDSYCVHTAATSDGSPSGGAWLFRYPNLALNVYAGGMNIERIVPDGPHRTRVVYDYVVAEETGDAAVDAMVHMSNVVLDEDQAICEAVQRNLDAGVYTTGRLSPKHEVAVAWFHSRLRA